jgi:hypothetical protein
LPDTQANPGQILDLSAGEPLSPADKISRKAAKVRTMADHTV